MSNATTDLPAFPIHGPLFATGLTKRELFAAIAMHGILANPDCNAKTYEAYAVDGVRYADALLAELAKPREGA